MKLNDKVICEMTKTFSQLANLREFEFNLDFIKNNVGNEGVINLFNWLKHKIWLNKIVLVIPYSDLSEKGIITMCNILAYKHELKSLKLDFTSCVIYNRQRTKSILKSTISRLQLRELFIEGI